MLPLVDWEPLRAEFGRLRSRRAELSQHFVALCKSAEEELDRREELETEVVLLRSQNAELSAAADELVEARAAVLELHAILEQLQTAPATQQIDAHFDEQVAKQIVGLERQRGEMEAELERVRSRAAELEQALDEEKRSAREQQAQLGREMVHLRELLERQAAQLSRYCEAQSHAAAGDAPVRHDEAGPASDPVVGSVMSQFELLQKDRIRRNAEPKAR